MSYHKKQLINFFGVIIFLLLSMCFLYEHEVFLAGLYIFIGGFLYFSMDKSDKIIYFTSIVLFTLGEFILTYFGVFAYSKGILFGLPLWLPFNWGLLALSLERISLVLNELYT
jgi:hypothetical protein